MELVLEQTQQGTSHEALKGLKNEKEFFQDQERYEHVGPQDTRPQDGERSQDDDQRLYLVDDLKKAQDHIPTQATRQRSLHQSTRYHIKNQRLRAEHKTNQKIAELKGTSSSSIASKLKSPSSSTSPSTNGYLNSLISPPPRVPPPPPTQGSEPMDITLTLSPITPLDIQFNTPSPPPPLFGHPIPWNLIEAHGDSCLCAFTIELSSLA
ncbi:hypothetical protein Tco_1204327 [Tanacetum coccineum]